MPFLQAPLLYELLLYTRKSICQPFCIQLYKNSFVCFPFFPTGVIRYFVAYAFFCFRNVFADLFFIPRPGGRQIRRTWKKHSGSLYSTPWRAAIKQQLKQSPGGSLFHVLEGGKVFFAGADFDDVENVIDKNLSISDVAGVECFAGGLDDFVHGNSGHDDFDLDLGQ